MNDDRSILIRLEELGKTAPRVDLEGSDRANRGAERFEILGEIARGGVGVVHRGRDNDLGREVALKVLRDDQAATPELVQRFIEEAQIGGQLQHPGIVPVYELGLRPDQRPFFAMKLVKGETLAARLANRADVSDGRRAILSVFREVCRTMAYAHARGVIHRDLKPSNVMIGSFGEVQVVDWGFAKVLSRGGRADEQLARKAEMDVTMILTVRSGEHETAESVDGFVMGTPGYMPPEQAMGRVDDLDEKGDIFSLGAILCEILTGQPPYTGTSEERMSKARRAQLEDAYARLESCDTDDRLVKICRHCLEPVPKDRPQSAQVIGNEIAASLSATESRAHRAQLRAIKAKGRAEEQQRSRRQTAVVVSSVLALILLGVGVWLWMDADRNRRESERRAAIESALRDASRLGAANQWEDARAAAQRAIDLGGEASVLTSIEAGAAEAATAARTKIEDAALLAQLEGIRTLYRVGRDEYGDALTVDGLDAEAEDRAVDLALTAAIERRFGSLAGSRDRLAASPHAREFAATLGFWSFLRKESPALESSDWTAVHRLACDVDPEREPIRNALAVVGLDSLVEAATAEGEALPLELVSEIGLRLERAGRAKEALAFMAPWKHSHPGDYWINVRLASVEATLGNALRATRFAFTAVAVRPRSAAAWIRLGLHYKDARAFVDGIYAIKQAMKIDPGHDTASAALNAVVAAKSAREMSGR